MTPDFDAWQDLVESQRYRMDVLSILKRALFDITVQSFIGDYPREPVEAIAQRMERAG